jgi:hypothetical protein
MLNNIRLNNINNMSNINNLNSINNGTRSFVQNIENDFSLNNPFFNRNFVKYNFNLIFNK